MNKHKHIIKHYEDCFAKYGDSNLGVDWPNKQDAEKRYGIMLDVIRNHKGALSLLDFGCGAAHLYDYLQDSPFSETGLEYHGLDASDAFCALSRKKHPNLDFICLDVILEPDVLGEFDYIVMNGVFTEKRDLDFEEMFNYFKEVIRIVFSKARHGIAFNVMSKMVDWERDDLFHLPTDTLINFLVTELSRHFVIRNDYGLYEYTVYVYKEAAICQK